MQPWCRLTNDVQYHFVKGQGWVPTTADTQVIVISVRGKRVTAEIRKPNLDEYFYYNSPSKHWCRTWRDSNGEFKFQEFVKYFVGRDLIMNGYIGCPYRDDRGIPKDALTVVFTVEDE